MPSEDDPFTYYTRNIIQDYHAKLKARLPLGADQSSSLVVSDDHLRKFPQEEKVGILGAGIGGLYAALILDSLGIEYELLEASDRTGGRISTYKFPGGGEYDYYDTGAMRFPLPKKDGLGQYKNGIMKRVAELIEYGPLNVGKDPLKDRLIPFHYSARNGSKPGYYYYNGIREPATHAPKGSFGAEGLVSTPNIFEPAMLAQDMETGKRDGWEMLMAHDLYSLRAYMGTKYIPSAHLELPPRPIPNNVINWCGLIGGGSPDGALAEIMLVMMLFSKVGDTDYADIDWKCLEGGLETLPKKIEEYLNKKGNSIQFNMRVTAISQSNTAIEIPYNFLEPPDNGPDSRSRGDKTNLESSEDGVSEDSTGPWTRIIKVPSVQVTVNGNESRKYSHVISTIPPSVLRTIDLTGAGLNVMQRNALIELEYSHALKIGMLFKTNWWTTKLGIVGGQTYTDLPIRTIVYPSHGVDSDTPSKVLIACYAFRGDADRLGTLATSEHRDALRELVLRNLAEAHGGLHPDVTYAYLKEQLVDMHVRDWMREENAMGAAGAFGPGEFQDFYASLTYPAASKRLHFAGEAVSTRHSWVVGALESVWRAVYGYLKITGQDEKTTRFKTLWGENCEWSGKSPREETVPGKHETDLLDEHLGLVDCAIRNSVIPLCHWSE